MSCPICSKIGSDAFRPFCSRRCADIDLARWLSGRYAIPTEEIAKEDAIGDAQIRLNEFH